MQNKLNFDNMALKNKFDVYNFVSYDTVEFLNTSLDINSPQIKSKITNLKKVFLTIGTETLKLQAVRNKTRNSKYKYKLISDDLKFIACKEAKLPFTLEVLTLNNESVESFDNLISIFKSINEEVIIAETPTIIETPKVETVSNFIYVGRYKMPKTENPDILYAYSLAEKNDISKTELEMFFFESGKLNIDNQNFKLTPQRRGKVEKIMYYVMKVKGIYISKDIHVLRSYIRVFHRIDESDYEEFTNMIMSDTAKSLLKLDETELKIELNRRGGSKFGFELPIQKRPRQKKKLQSV